MSPDEWCISELAKALSQRQLSMIAIGGVIGAGLFVGSGVVIQKDRSRYVSHHGLAGLLIIMVMRMLAEMAVANPATGSFADYARQSLGSGQDSRSAGCIGISG